MAKDGTSTYIHEDGYNHELGVEAYQRLVLDEPMLLD
jgi:hypothetical protein